MIIPLGVCRTINCRPVMTWTLLGINVSIYLLQHWIGRIFLHIHPSRWFDYLAFHYDRMAPWELITYQFIHDGFWHLFANMLIFYIISCAVEDRLGRWKTLALYILGGIAAAIVQAMFSLPFTQNPLQLLGASGSVFAVMGAFVLLMPWTDIKIYYFFIFFFYRIYSGTTKIPAFLFFGCYIFLFELLIAKITNPNAVAVAHWAHVGGFLFGFASCAALYGFGTYTRTEREQQKYERKKLLEKKAKKTSETSPPQIPAISKNKARPPLSIAIIERLVEMGRPQQAFEEFKLLRQAQPGAILSHDALLTLAKKLLANKSYKATIDTVKVAINNGGSPYETELIVTGANAAINLPESKREAAHFLKKAIEKLPEGQQRQRLKNQLETLENQKNETPEKPALDTIEPNQPKGQSRFNGLEIGDTHHSNTAFAENPIESKPPPLETLEQSDFAKERLSKSQPKGEIELLPANTSFDQLSSKYDNKPLQSDDESTQVKPKLQEKIKEALNGPLRHIGRFEPPIQMPEGLKRADMPYSYDKFTILPLGSIQNTLHFVETISKVMKQPIDDMLSRMKRSGGAIATSINRYDGEMIRDRLADAGIHVVLVPNFDGVHIPSTQLATSFDTNGAYVHFEIAKGSCEITTEEIGMVACGCVRLMPGAPVHSLVVDIASFAQDRRFRVVQPDTSTRTMQHARWEIQEMLPQVSPVIITQSIIDWTQNDEAPPQFRSPGHYDQYLRWHLMASLAEKYDDLV